MGHGFLEETFCVLYENVPFLFLLGMISFVFARFLIPRNRIAVPDSLHFKTPVRVPANSVGTGYGCADSILPERRALSAENLKTA